MYVGYVRTLPFLLIAAHCFHFQLKTKDGLRRNERTKIEGMKSVDLEAGSSKGDETEKLIASEKDDSVKVFSAVEQKKQDDAFAGTVVFACALYSFCSVSMVLVNKSLASR